MRQAQKIPAYLHPDNGQPPKPATGKSFIPSGQAFVDPADNGAYYSNGHGYFEGINMQCVREHPKHTLLPVAEEDCELGYGDLNRLHDYAKSVAREFGAKAEAEIDMLWIQDKLFKKGVQYERQRVPGSTDKTPFYVMAVLNGYTREAEDAIRLEIDAWAKRKREQQEAQKQQRREDREWLRTFADREIQQQMEQAKHEELTALYQSLFEKASAGGITSERFTALFNQTAEQGQSVQLTDDALKLLGAFIDNEIEVLKAKAAAKPVGVESAPADISAESVINDMAEDRPPARDKDDDKVDDTEPEDSEPPQESDGQQEEQGEAPPKRKTYMDDDGCFRYVDNDEYVELDAERVAELLDDAPVAEARPDEPKAKFTISDEAAARWYVRKIRKWQRELENAEAELKEASDAVKAIKSRTEADQKGLKFVLGFQLLAFVKSLLTKSDGTLKKQSHTFLEGTVKLKSKGGLVCYDPDAYKAWWKNMCDPTNDAERAMYEHNTTYSMNQGQIGTNIENGLDVPGWRVEDISEFAEFEVTAPPKPRSSSKKSTGDAESEAAA